MSSFVKMKWNKISPLSLLISLSSCKQVKSSFSVSFHSSGEVSADEWAEYTGSKSPEMENWTGNGIPEMKNWTTCYWAYIKNFNKDLDHTWSYCTRSRGNGPTISSGNGPTRSSGNEAVLKCHQFYTNAIRERANRHIRVNAVMNGFRHEEEIFPYSHRTWNHFCWSFQASKGTFLNWSQEFLSCHTE